MNKIICQICKAECAEIRDANLIAYSSHANNHAAEFAIEGALNALVETDTGKFILRDFYDNNEAINFIVK